MSISSIIGKLEEKLRTVPEETKTQLFAKLEIGEMERFKYLDLNARSFASGKIPLEASQFLYNKLMSYRNTTLAERIAIMETLGALAKI